jgi:hypothetical protein
MDPYGNPMGRNEGTIMPIELTYLDDGYGAEFKGIGVVTGEDILSANTEMFSTPEKTQRYRYGLADWTTVTEHKVTSADLQRAAVQDKNASKYLPELFIAIVADKDLEFGFSRMFAVFIEANNLDWKVMIFRERKDAEEWLRRKVKEKHQIELTFQ